VYGDAVGFAMADKLKKKRKITAGQALPVMRHPPKNGIDAI
jgi:hypothetical protein